MNIPMNMPNNDWQAIFSSEFEKPYFTQLKALLQQEYKCGIVYPNQRDLFNAFSMTTYQNTKIIILGQDPYHNPGQAHGLSFSVPIGTPIPPSLRNIFKELHQDIGCSIPTHGCLIPWAEQGVLLLNTVLSVREGSPQSHQHLGWQTFTDQIIMSLNDHPEPLVFMLWGNPAKEKKTLIDPIRHLVLEAAHPSPLAAFRGFFGCKHFSKANDFLITHQRTPIYWPL